MDMSQQPAFWMLGLGQGVGEVSESSILAPPSTATPVHFPLQPWIPTRMVFRL